MEACVVGIKATTTMTSKGQMTVPKDVRDRLGLRPGDKVEFDEDGVGFRVTKVCPENPFANYRGYLKEFAGKRTDDLIEEWRGR